MLFILDLGLDFLTFFGCYLFLLKVKETPVSPSLYAREEEDRQRTKLMEQAGNSSCVTFSPLNTWTLHGKAFTRIKDQRVRA